MRELDVGYVLVIFGGLTGYSSDGNNSSSSFESVSYCSTMFIKHDSECCESLKDWMLKWKFMLSLTFIYRDLFLCYGSKTKSFYPIDLHHNNHSWLRNRLSTLESHSIYTLIVLGPIMSEYTCIYICHVLNLHVNACRYKQVPMDGAYRRFDTRGRSHKGAWLLYSSGRV